MLDHFDLADAEIVADGHADAAIERRIADLETEIMFIENDDTPRTQTQSERLSQAKRELHALQAEASNA